MMTGMHGKAMPCKRTPKKMLWCKYVIEVVDVVFVQKQWRGIHTRPRDLRAWMNKD